MLVSTKGSKIYHLSHCLACVYEKCSPCVCVWGGEGSHTHCIQGLQWWYQESPSDSFIHGNLSNSFKYHSYMHDQICHLVGELLGKIFDGFKFGDFKITTL